MKKYMRICPRCKITFETDNASQTRCKDCIDKQDQEPEIEIEEETQKWNLR